MDVSRRCAGHDGLPWRETLFDQRRYIIQVGGAPHNRSFFPGVEQMDFPQIDPPVPQQSDGMGPLPAPASLSCDSSAP